MLLVNIGTENYHLQTFFALTRITDITTRIMSAFYWLFFMS